MAPIDDPTLMKFLYAFLIGIALLASMLLYWYLCFAEINPLPLAAFGLSSEEFRQIPVFLHPGRSDSSAVETACSICLEEFRRGEECLRMPACGHFFHAECVRPWLLESRTCPTCRGSVIV